MSKHRGMRMRGGAALITASLIAASTLSAGPPAKAGLDACAQIQRHRARLNCYDRLARQERQAAQASAERAGDAADSRRKQKRAASDQKAERAGQAAAPAVNAEPAAKPTAPAVNAEPAAKPAAATVSTEPGAKPAAAIVSTESAAKPTAPAVNTEPAEKPAPEVSRPASTPNAASASATFGLSRVAAEPSKIAVTIVNVRKTYYGAVIFTTQSGAVWKQTGTSRPVLSKPPFAATIERGALESFFLRPKGHRGAIRVLREQ